MNASLSVQTKNNFNSFNVVYKMKRNLKAEYFTSYLSITVKAMVKTNVGSRFYQTSES